MILFATQRYLCMCPSMIIAMLITMTRTWKKPMSMECEFMKKI